MKKSDSNWYKCRIPYLYDILKGKTIGSENTPVVDRVEDGREKD